MVRGGWDDAACVSFLRAVYAPLGGSATDHLMCVRTSRSAEKPTGFRRLKEYVPAKIVDAARELMGLSEEIELPPGFMEPAIIEARPVTGNRKQKGSNRMITHVPGTNATPDKCRSKVKMSEIIRLFRGCPEWIGVWQYDEFKRQLIAVDPPMRLDAEVTGLSDSDVTAVVTWFEAAGFLVSDKQVASAIQVAAKLTSFHPVREYLMGLQRPTSVGLLDGLSARVLGNTAASAATFMKLFLVSAVRRILWPGTKVDTMLVLYSPKEGRFKSQLAETLFGAEWFRDQMPALDGRDASHALEGSWGIEIPELDRIMRAETSTTKEFLSRRVDKYRAFGTGAKIEYPRQCVFIGTTNYPDFLESDTGNRRFWPVEVFGQIDLAFVRTYRDAIWAEAVALALDPSFKHWLDEAQEIAAAEVRIGFDKRDPWHEAVESYCLGRDEIGTAAQVYLERIAVGEDGALSKATKVHTNRIAAILRKLECRSETKWDPQTQKNIRVWRTCDALRTQPRVGWAGAMTN